MLISDVKGSKLISFVGTFGPFALIIREKLQIAHFALYEA